MRTVNSRRLMSCAVLVCLLLGGSAFAQERPGRSVGSVQSRAVRGAVSGFRAVPNPEPLSLGLLALGGVGLAYSVRRRRREDRVKG
jgi:hypothetical protein